MLDIIMLAVAAATVFLVLLEVRDRLMTVWAAAPIIWVICYFAAANMADLGILRW